MNVLMPQLGETVAEGKITKWFKSAGDGVKPGDNLFEIETDKVSMEVPATSAGVLAEIRVPAGAVASVGAVVAVISDGAGAAASARAGAEPAGASPVPSSPMSPTTRAGDTEQVAPRPPAAPPPPIKLDPFFEVRTPARNYGPARLPSGTFVTPPARRAGRHRSRRGHAIGGAWSHRGARCRSRARDRQARRSRGDAVPRLDRGPGQGALPGCVVRGNAARQYAQDHRRAAHPGEANHSAFLPDGGRRDRPAARAARASQRGGGAGPTTRVQALDQ